MTKNVNQNRNLHRNPYRNPIRNPNRIPYRKPNRKEILFWSIFVLITILFSATVGIFSSHFFLIIIPYIPIIVFIAQFISITGKTWNPVCKGFKKLTRLGLIVTSLTIFTLSLSVSVGIRKNINEKEEAANMKNALFQPIVSSVLIGIAPIRLATAKYHKSPETIINDYLTDDVLKTICADSFPQTKIPSIDYKLFEESYISINELIPKDATYSSAFRYCFRYMCTNLNNQMNNITKYYGVRTSSIIVDILNSYFVKNVLTDADEYLFSYNYSDIRDFIELIVKLDYEMNFSVILGRVL
jgi:hypothetical protein